MKTKKIIVLLIIGLLLLTIQFSCGSLDDNAIPDAVPFKYYTKVETETAEITIYELSNIQNVYYGYEEFGKSSEPNWTINYIYSYDYYVDDENIPDSLYDELNEVFKTSILNYSLLLQLELTCNKDGTKEEREIQVSLEANDEVYMIDLYIPYKIVYQDTISHNYMVMLPVYTFLAIKNNDLLKFNDQTYNFNEFINQTNVFKK